MEVLIVLIGSISLFFILISVRALLRGWVLHTLWLWFVVPVFDTAPVISIAHAMGVSLMISFLTFQYNPIKDELKKEYLERILFVVMYPFMVLLVSWIIKQFI